MNFTKKIAKAVADVIVALLGVVWTLLDLRRVFGRRRSKEVER